MNCSSGLLQIRYEFDDLLCLHAVEHPEKIDPSTFSFLLPNLYAEVLLVAFPRESTITLASKLLSSRPEFHFRQPRDKLNGTFPSHRPDHRIVVVGRSAGSRAKTKSSLPS